MPACGAYGAHHVYMDGGLLRRYSAFFVDVDGVLLRGAEPVDGAVQALCVLQSVGKVVLATNNSTRSRQALAASLAVHGFKMAPEAIVTSAYGAAHHLLGNHGPVSVWPVGEQGLREELLACGHRLVSDPKGASWVVAGMDRHLTHETLTHALTALDGGARLLATNEDGTFPAPEGRRPGAGAVVGALRGMGYPPEIVVGKPERVLFDLAIQAAGVGKAQVLMIGDRLETDIAGGTGYGIDTLLVLTGISTKQSIVETGIEPTWVSESLAAALAGHVASGIGCASRVQSIINSIPAPSMRQGENT